ncbi:response regulator [Limnochorda pilosa]|uniref:LuxR family transcriptional regulator n=1 Tax=Limnochorda pilosa TaxID=1555112 RepID=A0A0K2SPJ8_LIMPI|nr:response regulator transcription factor [Limnochorda pilosa]BAS29045.1 LuxR family transcriptional regulator [Limnochorda pilosa]
MGPDHGEPIRILVVDDHAVVRQGLRTFLEIQPDLLLAGEASSGEEALPLARLTLPDVVLMDLILPGMDGVEATRRLLAQQPGCRVVVLTSFGEEGRVLSALEAGAAGYLLKTVDPDRLVAAVREAAAGGSPLSPEVSRRILAHMQRPTGLQPGAALTSRERQVLDGVTAGLSNKEIAARLGIGEKTVKSHLTHVFAKMGVEGRTQAALEAVRRGLAGGGAPR